MFKLKNLLIIKMNIIEDDRNEFYDLLHYLTGDYEKKNEGYFFI